MLTGLVPVVALLAVADPRLAGDFVVALDPGHGGTNLGTVGAARVQEKHLTLDLARRVRRLLAGRPRVRVVMCRDADVLVPVRARVRCANEAGARLYVSLHANASPEGPARGSQRGFELYILPVAQVDREAELAVLAAPDDARALLALHDARAAATQARDAAERLRWELADALGAERDRGVKQAGASLDVLQGLAMPGVLVEVGFLDHPEEAAFLASEEGKETIAAALARGIVGLAARELRGRTDPSITAQRRSREKNDRKSAALSSPSTPATTSTR